MKSKWIALAALAVAGCARVNATPEEADAATDAPADAYAPADASPDADADADAVAVADADADADADAIADADADADAIADADADASPPPDAYGIVPSPVFAPAGLPTASGTRLRARFLTAAGGARAFVGFHDSLLDVDCSANFDETGTLRCLPDAPEVLYTDATCGTPVVGTCVGCAKPKFASEVSSIGPSCEELRIRWRMHSVGDAVPAASGLYAHSFTGTCYSTSTGTMTLRAVTDAVDSSSFVAFASQWELHGDLLAHVLVGSDGARYVTDLHDSKTLRSCAGLTRAYTSFETCVPGPLAFDTYPPSRKADPPCTEGVESSNDPLCPLAPMYFSMTWSSSSATVDYLFAVDGPAWTPLVTPTGTCTAAGAKPGDWFVHGPVLAKLPAVAVVPQGTGALRALFRGNDAEAILPLGVLREASSGTQCKPMRFPDGQLHCLTRSASAAIYSDAACKSPVIGVSGSTAPTTAASYDVVAGEDVLRGVYDVGAVHPLTSIYVPDGGVCVARTPGFGAKYYDVGASHDLSSFAVITPVTE